MTLVAFSKWAMREATAAEERELNAAFTQAEEKGNGN